MQVRHEIEKITSFHSSHKQFPESRNLTNFHACQRGIEYITVT